MRELKGYEAKALDAIKRDWLMHFLDASGGLLRLTQISVNALNSNISIRELEFIVNKDPNSDNSRNETHVMLPFPKRILNLMDAMEEENWWESWEGSHLHLSIDLSAFSENSNVRKMAERV